MPDQGELWRSIWQAGKEVTPGTAVAATRRLYVSSDDSTITGPNPTTTEHKFAVGRRDNTLARTRGMNQPGGAFKMALSPDECLEFYAMGLAPSAAPSGGVFTFTPGNTSPDAGTLRVNDGANVWISAGTHVSELTWSGNKNKGSELSGTLFSMSSVAGALTGSLTDRSPEFYEGWETQLFIDAFEGTPGTTAVDLILASWDVKFSNKLERLMFADNTRNASGISVQEYDLTAQFTFHAKPAATVTELTNAAAETGRLVQLVFGQTGETTKLTIPGFWTAEDLGQKEQGVRTYRMTLGYVYDPTNAYGFQVAVESARAGVWA
jgi:hypothetical protein